MQQERPERPEQRKSPKRPNEPTWPARVEAGVDTLLRKTFRVAGLTPRLQQRLIDAWRTTLRRLMPLGGGSVGNAIEVLDDGDAAFQAKWDAIDAAQHQVLFETYIFVHDAVGAQTLRHLEQAAKRGVDVWVLLDQFGSGMLTEDELAPLKAAGAHVMFFNPFVRSLLRFVTGGDRGALTRDHRKLLVVDGRTGFAGGMNVEARYAGARLGTGEIRDTDVRVDGPAAQDLGNVFRGSVRQAGHEPPVVHPLTGPLPEPPGVTVQVLQSNVHRDMRAIQKALRLVTRRAQHAVWLCSPYFVPPLGLQRAMKFAARRGVDVRVLTASLNSDVPAVTRAGRSLYDGLLKAGVRIFEYDARRLHAKVAVVDKAYAQIGSFNLDRLSNQRNLEVMLSFLDRAHATRLASQFEADLAGATEITRADLEKRTWLERAREWLAFQLMRF